MYKPYGTGSVKIWKTGHTISADIRKFLQCAKTAPAASASCMEFHIACIRQADFWRRKAVILGRIACTWCTDAALCFRYHTVTLCVSVSGTTVGCRKMAEPIEMPFGVYTRGAAKKDVL